MDWRLMVGFFLFAVMHQEIFIQQEISPTVQEKIMLPNITEVHGTNWED